MLIDVTKIKKIAGKAFPFKLEAQWPPLELQGETLSFKGPLTVEGTATNTGRIILVDGTVSVTLQRPCGRCLEPVTQSLQVPFSEEYLHVSEKGQDLAGTDEEKLVIFEGNNIDLAPQVRENLLLELPMSGLCREDCRGLCPVCGQNLNVRECDCQPVNIDPRLQVLEKFLKS